MISKSLSFMFATSIAVVVAAAPYSVTACSHDEVASKTDRAAAYRVFSAAGFTASAEDESIFLAPPDLDDAALANIPTIKSRFGLSFGGNQITNRGLKSLSRFEGMTSLNLLHTAVTLEGNCGLDRCLNLSELSLLGSPVTDPGIAEISRLPALTYLDLRKTHVSGSGLPHLARVKSLQTLEIEVTD